MTYRIATVSFLNCVPLVDWFSTPEGAERVTLTGHLPSRLAGLLADGAADAALLPTAELLRGRAAGLIGRSGIACRGPVDSVKLFHNGPASALRRVAVDRGSRTSVALLRVLLAETAGCAPPFVEVEPRPGVLPGPGDGVLVIGDRCFAFDRWRRLDPAVAGALTVMDLGQAWLEFTGLPFVFAAWAAAPGLVESGRTTAVRDLADLLDQARNHGLGRLSELAAREAAAGALGPGGEATPAAIEHYFRRSLRYRLGDTELEGIQRFRDLCIAHRLVAPTEGPVLL